MENAIMNRVMSRVETLGGVILDERETHTTTISPNVLVGRVKRENDDIDEGEIKDAIVRLVETQGRSGSISFYRAPKHEVRIMDIEREDIRSDIFPDE